MDIETWAIIRRLHLRDGLSQREIAKRTGHHRDTVARALVMETYRPPPRPKRGSMLDRFKLRILEILETYPKLNAVRIREELQKHGYRGGVSILKDYLRELRPRPREAFAKLHFEPGSAFQVDWVACGSILHHGVQRRLSAFLMLASWSRMLYVEFTISESTEEFLRCHQNAFEFFGGVFRIGIYDNAKVAVLYHVGDEVRFNPKLLDFAGFYLFEPRACRVRRPQEKGGVENSARYLRSSFLAGRSFHSLAEVLAAAVRWRDEVANVRVHRGTLRRPVDLFEEEQRHLRALPPARYDTRVVLALKATHQWRLRFEANTYSVPPEYVGEVLTLKASPSEVTIYAGENEVARHRRAWGRGEDVVDPEHERALCARKRRATGSMLEREFRSLSPEAGAYLEGLSRAALNPFVHMRKILQLASLYSQVEVAQAVERALAHEAFGFDYIENIVLQERRRRSRPQESPPARFFREDLEALSVKDRDLEEYEQLLEEKEDRKSDEPEETDASR
jgi:transposase